MKRFFSIILFFLLIILPNFVIANDFQEMIDDMSTALGFIVSLITIPAFIVVLVIVLFVILFYAVISAGMSSLPIFSNDEKHKRTISLVLAILMTIGLIGGGGLSEGSWSPENFQTNIARIMSPFGALSPLLLGLLMGAVVYFSITKNNPNMSQKVRRGWTLIAFSIGIYVASSVSIRTQGQGSWWAFGLSVPIFLIGLLGVMVKEGEGLGKSNFFSRVSDKILERIEKTGKTPEERKAKNIEKTLKRIEKKRSKDKFDFKSQYDDSKLKTLINDATSRLNKEKDNYAHEYTELEKIHNMISKFKELFDKKNFDELKKTIFELKKDINNESRTERRNLRQNRRVFRDFKRSRDDILADKNKYEKFANDLRHRTDIPNHQELYNEISEILEFQKSLETIVNALQRFVLSIETDEKKIIKVENEIIEDLNKLHKQIANHMNSTDNERNKIQSLVKDIFSNFSKCVDTNFDLLKQIANNIKEIEKWEASLISQSNNFSRLSEDIASKINEIDQQSSTSVDAIDDFIKSFHESNERYFELENKYVESVSVFFKFDDNNRNNNLSGLFNSMDSYNINGLIKQFNELLQNPIVNDESIRNMVSDSSVFSDKINFLNVLNSDVANMKRLNDGLKEIIRELNLKLSKPNIDSKSLSTALESLNSITEKINQFSLSDFFKKHASQNLNILERKLKSKKEDKKSLKKFKRNIAILLLASSLGGACQPLVKNVNLSIPNNVKQNVEHIVDTDLGSDLSSEMKDLISRRNGAISDRERDNIIDKNLGKALDETEKLVDTASFDFEGTIVPEELLSKMQQAIHDEAEARAKRLAEAQSQPTPFMDRHNNIIKISERYHQFQNALETALASDHEKGVDWAVDEIEKLEREFQLEIIETELDRLTKDTPSFMETHDKYLDFSRRFMELERSLKSAERSGNSERVNQLKNEISRLNVEFDDMIYRDLNRENARLGSELDRLKVSLQSAKDASDVSSEVQLRNSIDQVNAQIISVQNEMKEIERLRNS